MAQDRNWVNEAVRRIDADFNRSADTHLLRLELPGAPGIPLYFKDESTHPTGSLKHRLARSLFLYALCNGWVGPGTTIVEASSGSTAVSEAYFARLLGLPFIAVVPKSTSPEKLAQIEFQGGKLHKVDKPGQIYSESLRLAQESGGHFMDQFTFAERVTDWRGNNNIADSIFEQMQGEEFAEPRWIVCGAGTGGTSATIGRYVRYRRFETRVCVVDPEYSVFYDFYHSGDCTLSHEKGSRVERIGRPRVEASFVPQVVDRMIKVPDAASYAALRYLERVLGRKVGGSTGTNLIGAAQVIAGMRGRGETGAVVTLICDPGERYLDSYFDDHWLADNGFDIRPDLAQLEQFHAKGEWQQP
ncbi:MAG: PLP-dependent cysteine synthase family protein [Alphaproteobacteria bacterium]|jgi:cysteine synthase A|nr:PLP-dependent cysteine synthase family protein [Alphaproteobacteria bacterium]